MKLKNTLISIALVAASAVAGAANLVSNGGFETGVFDPTTDWAQTGDPTFVGIGSNVVHSGTNAAFFGPVEGTFGGITQSISTLAGHAYSVSFFLAAEAPLTTLPNPNSFEFVCDANCVGVSLSNSAPFSYTSFSDGFTATGSSTSLSFDFSNDQAYWWLDDVVVEDLGCRVDCGGSTPEPGSLALVGLAVLALGVTRRRRPS